MEEKKDNKTEQKKTVIVSCFVCKQQVPQEQTKQLRRNGKECVRVCSDHIKL